MIVKDTSLCRKLYMPSETSPVFISLSHIQGGPDMGTTVSTRVPLSSRLICQSPGCFPDTRAYNVQSSQGEPSQPPAPSQLRWLHEENLADWTVRESGWHEPAQKTCGLNCVHGPNIIGWLDPTWALEYSDPI